jgi:hypothetical protein
MPDSFLCSDRKFLVRTSHFQTVRAPLIERPGFPPATFELITARRNGFAAKLSAAMHADGTVQAKNDVREVLAQALRQAIDECLTDENRRNLGLPVHDREPVPSVVRIYFQDEVAGHAGRQVRLRVGALRFRALEKCARRERALE